MGRGIKKNKPYHARINGSLLELLKEQDAEEVLFSTDLKALSSIELHGKAQKPIFQLVESKKLHWRFQALDEDDQINWIKNIRVASELKYFVKQINHVGKLKRRKKGKFRIAALTERYLLIFKQKAVAREMLHFSSADIDQFVEMLSKDTEEVWDLSKCTLAMSTENGFHLRLYSGEILHGIPEDETEERNWISKIQTVILERLEKRASVDARTDRTVSVPHAHLDASSMLMKENLVTSPASVGGAHSSSVFGASRRHTAKLERVSSASRLVARDSRGSLGSNASLDSPKPRSQFVRRVQRGDSARASAGRVKPKAPTTPRRFAASVDSTSIGKPTIFPPMETEELTAASDLQMGEAYRKLSTVHKRPSVAPADEKKRPSAPPGSRFSKGALVDVIEEEEEEESEKTSVTSESEITAEIGSSPSVSPRLSEISVDTEEKTPAVEPRNEIVEQKVSEAEPEKAESKKPTPPVSPRPSKEKADEKTPVIEPEKAKPVKPTPPPSRRLSKEKTEDKTPAIEPDKAKPVSPGSRRFGKEKFEEKTPEIEAVKVNPISLKFPARPEAPSPSEKRRSAAGKLEGLDEVRKESLTNAEPKRFAVWPPPSEPDETEPPVKTKVPARPEAPSPSEKRRSAAGKLEGMDEVRKESLTNAEPKRFAVWPPPSEPDETEPPVKTKPRPPTTPRGKAKKRWNTISPADVVKMSKENAKNQLPPVSNAIEAEKEAKPKKQWPPVSNVTEPEKEEKPKKQWSPVANVVEPEKEEKAKPLQSAREWSSNDVHAWLLSLGKSVAKYADNFLEEGIDGEFLLDDLDEEMLEEFVDRKVSRKVIWKKIEQLREDSQ
eukprot:863939_1